MFSLASRWWFAATSAIRSKRNDTTLLARRVAGRRLFIAFTIRGNLLRVISVRDMNQREMEAYASLEKKTGA